MAHLTDWVSTMDDNIRQRAKGHLVLVWLLAWVSPRMQLGPSRIALVQTWLGPISAHCLVAWKHISTLCQKRKPVFCYMCLGLQQTEPAI
jgi:hypothetical protein